MNGTNSRASGDTSVVLLVEDQEYDVELMRRAFRVLRLRNPLHVVTDGDQAIRYLEGSGEFANREEYPLPSVVLLDLKLPRRTGFEVLKWIREQPTLRSIRVIVLTSSQLLDEVNYAYNLGANSFLTKPTNFKQFLSEIQIVAQYWLMTDQAPAVSRSPRRKKSQESQDTLDGSFPVDRN